MNRLLSLLVICLMLAAYTISVSAQGGGTAVIGMLGRQGQSTTSLVDGNQVKLTLKLSAPLSSASQAAFFLDDSDKPVAGCTLAAGSDTCASDPVSTLGWFWGTDSAPHPARQIKAVLAGQPLEGALDVTIKPRPVIMVHGFNSSWQTWQSYQGPNGFLAKYGLQGFAVGDGQGPGLLNTGSLSNPAGRTNSIAQNAAVLNDYIAAIQKQTGAEKVDLLVHSMGGMISRYYLDRVMTTDNVAQLIFLGTPNSGSACVYPLAALGYLEPASLEILPDYMVRIFNRQISHRHGARFSMLAGTLLPDPLMSPCADAPSDTVVGLNSATSITMDQVQKLPDYHGDLTSDKQVFDNFVIHQLQLPPSEFTPRPDTPNPGQVVDPGQFSRAYTGHINPGGRAQVTIDIDPNVSLANFSLYDSSRSLQLEVRGASGNVINLDPTANGMLKIDNPETMLYLGYGFKQPKPGKWVVTLIATANTPAQGADYSIDARYTGGAALEASSDTSIPAAGQAVTFTARLTNGGPGATVDSIQALIHKPDGSQVTLLLKQVGDSYTVQYHPEQPGLYSAQVLLTGKTADGFAIDRAAYLAFEMQPGSTPGGQNLIPVLVAVGLLILCLGLVVILLLVFWQLRRRSKKA